MGFQVFPLPVMWNQPPSPPPTGVCAHMRMHTHTQFCYLILGVKSLQILNQVMRSYTTSFGITQWHNLLSLLPLRALEKTSPFRPLGGTGILLPAMFAILPTLIQESQHPDQDFIKEGRLPCWVHTEMSNHWEAPLFMCLTSVVVSS